ncbi:MAG: SDR family NAD(P)-dependent oxidoreductase [Chloroflexi bacterium]|nr:SDR family NAD(P)-dependent oxidoreductase [Ardenticatenaceae bacterium]MBL1128828.1 SDR family NAD(P)-dependent oxidoreductase [Chloroflexota bacterium]NOG34906.1 SDR family NAD(P)-dependent oxidoreductase [Chloroflexota bacterium]GIK58069.1 MAG: short-chain dehydrogenase [Chloroflexota bacterium]
MTNATSNPTRPLEPQKRALVVGASSGIGAALACELARQGYIVAALARRESLLQELCQRMNTAVSPAKILPYTHNVTAYDEIPGLFQAVVRDLGGLDLIVYAAGTQPHVALDEYDFAKDRAMIEVNLLGAIAWLNQAAHRFERAGSGHIVGISSIAGDRGRVGAPVYNASKAGLNTYLEALRNRLTRRGVTVTTIKPGFVDTVLLENAPKTFWVISPEQAAAAIFQAIRRKKQTIYLPTRWALVSLIIRHIPSFIFRRMKF